MSETHAAGDADPLRNSLVDAIKQRIPRISPAVETAFRAVARHQFLPGTPLTEAYADDVVVTQRIDGVATSSSSCPSLMAHMLELLRLEPGQRVLEIGTGTGYNAALMGRIVGPGGKVTTIEVDSEIAAQARRLLREAGSDNVSVLTGNGTAGHAPDAPYDRIILTVASPRIFPEWWDQLAPDGRFVGPLFLRNVQVLLSFGRRADEWISDGIVPVGFVTLREEGEHGHELAPQSEFVFVAGQSDVTAQQVAALLRAPGEIVETDLTVSLNELFVLQLWLAVRSERSCSLATLDGTTSTPPGLFPCIRVFDRDGGTFGLASPSELCLVAPAPGDRADPKKPFKISVYCYGRAGDLRPELHQAITRWDRNGRGMKKRPAITATRSPDATPTGGPVHRVHAGEVSYIVDWI